MLSNPMQTLRKLNYCIGILRAHWGDDMHGTHSQLPQRVAHK